MDQHEIDAELSESGAQEILKRTSAHLSYIALDGTPRVTPVGVLWTGAAIVTCTATTAPKLKALAVRPDVAVAMDSGNTPEGARAVSIRGRASVDVVDGIAEEYLEMARRSMAPDAAREFEANVRKMYPQQARIVITPTWARFYDFGRGRLPKFLQELADNMG